MEHQQAAGPHEGRASAAAPTSPGRRNSSGSSILSKLPFLRTPATDGKSRPTADEDVPSSSPTPSLSMSNVLQQQRSRPRKGSLRKVALLGRGAQREKREAKSLTIDTKQSQAFGREEQQGRTPTAGTTMADDDDAAAAGGLNISDITPRPSMDGFASRTSLGKASDSSKSAPSQPQDGESLVTSPTISYTSTTDEEDVLHLPSHLPSAGRPDLSLSSGSESYFSPDRAAAGRRRSIQHAKSPLSYSGLAATPLPAPDSDYDYSETEWWGWVVLIVTWLVFVIGMGSCLDVWSWAWDVGTTPYAPPELEDDPTLPIVGYYPALMILTCVMAWVWVVFAWIGMKYFRHAKISGD